jgi:sugar phosphate isomerase/epimerase
MLPQDQPGRPGESAPPFELGIASYSYRAFTLDQAIAMTRRVGIRRISLKDMHLPLASSRQEIAAALGKLHEAGVELTACGVVYMTKEADVQQAFAYAKAVGLRLLVGAPDPSLLVAVEAAVRQTGIVLAIHNHGPSDPQFPSPESVYRRIEKLDRRIGLCIDLGHTQRLGLDPAAQVERFFDRVYDLHIKDVSAAAAVGETVEIGRGVMDIPAILRTLVRLQYSGTVHIEFEKDEHDPLPGVAESAGYLRGVLAALGHQREEGAR